MKAQGLLEQFEKAKKSNGFKNGFSVRLYQFYEPDLYISRFQGWICVGQDFYSFHYQVQTNGDWKLVRVIDDEPELSLEEFSPSPVGFLKGQEWEKKASKRHLTSLDYWLYEKRLTLKALLRKVRPT